MKSFNLRQPGLRPARVLVLAALLGSMAFVTGCANNSASSSVYTYGQAQREQIVRVGTVQSVRPITIQLDKTSGAGVVAGGALGGVAGSAVGGGRGNVLATIGGGLLGALAGNAVENQVNRKNGLEITVRLDNGETRVVAQEADVAISAGQRVRMISGNGPTRVVPF
ncbi:glycine zipper 2TM domain-containing protein [Pusillimonas sp. ANT_WB101]|uniref:glycine zipper 2TM domain-containing protein n=1 Tax=Pusillimonas sp. ANT_WB101 TaxID=2597356 RepID=UPI0011EE1034|nr:glycine zipper 2TM domain-containing protein [Pusillimonas sp. ANT_WB101]KAA0889217.1 glycine zipper 2TM domain-containing protein [Pusillimonas sp. ANT_WB101]NYT78768.1 glycine zipper 2TM domain-containing protein [Alcaligenaceae bacterium]